MPNRQTKSAMEAPRQTLIIVAWTAMLLVSNLAIICWLELAGGEPHWWPWVHAIGLLTLFAVTLFSTTLKSLRRYVLVLLIIFFLGFGGGWDWGFIPFPSSSLVWTNWERQMPWALSAIATHLLRLVPALVIFVFSLLTGLRRSDLFLARRKIDALVEPSRLLGMKKSEPWTLIGSVFAVVFTVVTFVVLMVTWKPSSNAFVNAITADSCSSAHHYNERFQ